MLPCAAKLGLLSKGSRGGFLQRGLSGRKAARSDYEEQQVLLGLKAVEKMKQMVLVSSRAQSHSCGTPWRERICSHHRKDCVGLIPLRKAGLLGSFIILMLEQAHSQPSIQQTGAGTQQYASYTWFTEHACDMHRHLC